MLSSFGVLKEGLERNSVSYVYIPLNWLGTRKNLSKWGLERNSFWVLFAHFNMKDLERGS